MFRIFLRIFIFFGLFFTFQLFADGLRGKYYDNDDFTNLKLTRVDPTINFDWGNGSPDASIGSDTFSIEWTGFIYIPENAWYRFSLAHDDIMVLTIDGVELYNNSTWTGGSNNYNNTGWINLTTGYHPITIRFTEWSGGAYAKFAWRNNKNINSRTIVPTSNLFPPTPSISIGNESIVEGNSGTKTMDFTISLSDSSDSAVSVNYTTVNGTATAGSDYVASSGTLTIPAGQTSGTISVTINGDTSQESDETFKVNLSNPTNATLDNTSATGTILDDDTPPVISVANTSVTEGNTAPQNMIFTLTLDHSFGEDVSVDYTTVDGTATAGSDYVTSSGTVTIPAGKQVALSQ